MPAPAAIRFLRDALRRSGFFRSCGVIDRIIACCCFKRRSSIPPAASSCFFIFPIPGINFIRPPMPPIFSIWPSCFPRSSKSNVPFSIFLATRSASFSSITLEAFSTRETISPWPRIRPASLCASKASSASSFSPIPRNLIGRPVTARIESAAPPRPSPSMRVSTSPVRGRRA